MKVYNVPAHDTSRPPDDPNNSTDLASVPAYLWWFVASHGKHTLPALLHDQLVDDRDQAPKREEADLVFRYALRESDVSWLRRRLMYIAVARKAFRAAEVRPVPGGAGTDRPVARRQGAPLDFQPARPRERAGHGAVAEWLGRGLQSLAHQFDSGRRLFCQCIDSITRTAGRT